MLILANLTALLQGGGTQGGLIVAFLLAAAVVVISGTKLSSYGDALSEWTGLGAGLVGLLFLAAVTSLPELVVSTTSTIAASVKVAGLTSAAERALTLGAGADLAIGNMVGSNVFNLMLFVIVDLVQGKGALLYRLSRNHVMSAASGLWMLGILLFGFALSGRLWGGTDWVIPYLECGPVTPMLFVGYIVVMVLQGRLEKREDGHTEGAPEVDSETDERLVSMPAARFYGALLLLVAMIVCSGIWLSLLGDQMAVVFGLKQSFVGTVFLALSTSLPELVVSIAAARMGAFNMAAGNVLGSNIFNIVIVFTSDLGLRNASILHYADPSHLVTIGMVMTLTCTIIIGLMYRSEHHAALLGFDCWVMLLIYIIGNAMLYWSGTGTQPGAVPAETKTLTPAAAMTGTEVQPVTDVPLSPGDNTIYCGTFQLAWNGMQNDLIKQPLKIEDAPDWVQTLNTKPFTQDALSPECYLAMSGSVKQGIVDKIRRAMAAKFPNATMGVSDIPAGKGDTLLAYAYLVKILPFRAAFSRLDKPLAFETANGPITVEAFGLEPDDHDGLRGDELREQVSVLDYADPDSFVIRLNTRSEQDELILAKVTPEATLAATLAAVLARAEQPRTESDGADELQDGEPFAVPVLDLNVSRVYHELLDKYLLNPG